MNFQNFPEVLSKAYANQWKMVLSKSLAQPAPCATLPNSFLSLPLILVPVVISAHSNANANAFLVTSNATKRKSLDPSWIVLTSTSMYPKFPSINSPKLPNHLPPQKQSEPEFNELDSFKTIAINTPNSPATKNSPLVSFPNTVH